MAKPSGSCCLTVEEFEQRFVKPAPGRALIVGSKTYPNSPNDRRKLYDDAIGIDMIEGDGVDHVMDLQDNIPFWLGPFSHCECISVLEHCTKPWQLAHNIELLLKRGSTLHVGVPWTWRLHNYPTDLWRMNCDTLRFLFPNIEWKALQMIHGGPEEKVPSFWQDGFLYFKRATAVGFGVKK